MHAEPGDLIIAPPEIDGAQNTRPVVGIVFDDMNDGVSIPRDEVMVWFPSGGMPDDRDNSWVPLARSDIFATRSLSDWPHHWVAEHLYQIIACDLWQELSPRVWEEFSRAARHHRQHRRHPFTLGSEPAPGHGCAREPAEGDLVWAAAGDEDIDDGVREPGIVLSRRSRHGLLLVWFPARGRLHELAGAAQPLRCEDATVHALAELPAFRVADLVYHIIGCSAWDALPASTREQIISIARAHHPEPDVPSVARGSARP